MDHITDQDIFDVADLHKNDLVEFLTRLSQLAKDHKYIPQLIQLTATAKRAHSKIEDILLAADGCLKVDMPDFMIADLNKR